MGAKGMAESSTVVRLILPWPPSVNHYYRHTKRGHFISEEGRNYRKFVQDACVDEPSFDKDERLKVAVFAYPPDKRRRDLDNLFKSLLDSLQHAGVFVDDSQIDDLSISRHLPLTGHLYVVIEPLKRD